MSGTCSGKKHALSQGLRDEVSDENPNLEFDPFGLDLDEDHDVDVDNEVDGDASQPKKKSEVETASRSLHWVHFEKFICNVEQIRKARYIYCGAVIRVDPRKYGTKPLGNHLIICPKNPKDVVQTQINLQQTHMGGDDGNSSWKFDQVKTRNALIFWLIVDELPFKTVDNQGFRFFMSVVCLMFSIPSRWTVARDIYKLYIDGKSKLKDFIKNKCDRICLTTDTWTSVQRVNYMCLTAHFIDRDWKLQKRILNFCPISGYKSEKIGKGVEKCLLDWGIEKIFTVTVDNASSNDGAITYLLKIFDHWGTNLLGGKYVHMRCIAHIVNLIVQDGLKNKDEHLANSRIRGAVRYIRSSPARCKRFQECVELKKLETNKLLCLDVPTRWNSTYLMLESAICLRLAFDAYEDTDLAYKSELSKSDGVPTYHDWARGSLLLKFLSHFYKLALSISGSLYVTSSRVFLQTSEVEVILNEWLVSNDFELKRMARRMKEKFDKYWGAIEKMNMILYYAVVLDPHHKFVFLNFSFGSLYGDSEKSTMMKDKVRRGLEELFGEYKLRYGSASPNPPFASTTYGMSVSIETSSCLIERFNKHFDATKTHVVKSELEKYISEDREEDNDVVENECSHVFHAFKNCT